MSWEPLVTGEEANALREIVAEIAAAPNPDTSLDALADRAVFHAYTETGAPEADMAALVEQMDQVHDLALFNGACRIGWTLAHLADGVAVDMVCESIDQALTSETFARTGYDLISGLVGLGVYALERGPAGVPIVERIVDALHARAQPRNGGLAWPEDDWNLGLAHGVPGVIALCARACAAGIPRAREVLNGAATYLAATSQAPFPQREGQPQIQRVAWCYGDLGIAVALVGAGVWVDDDELRARGRTLALRCAGLGTDGFTLDATLCHGAAGNAHLFNRMAQATGEPLLGEAARAWLRRAIAMRTNDPIAGFPHVQTNNVRAAAGTLIYGAPGVGLVLHAAISEQEPTWDRLFLADIPVQSRN